MKREFVKAIKIVKMLIKCVRYSIFHFAKFPMLKNIGMKCLGKRIFINHLMKENRVTGKINRRMGSLWRLCKLP